MNPSRPFIRRPVATTLLMVGLLLAGIVGFRSCRSRRCRRSTTRRSSSRRSTRARARTTMASAVTTPLERQFGQMPALTQMTSIELLGSSSITLQFALDRNIDAAEQDVQAAINAAGTYLPRDLPTPPIYSKSNPADAPILTLALTSTTLPLAQVDDYADSRLAQKISQVPGVGLVSINGGQKPAVRVQVNPTALASLRPDARGRAHRASSRPTSTSPRATSTAPRQAYTIGANDQLLTSDRVPAARHRLRERRARAPLRRRRRHRRRRERAAGRRGRTTTPAVILNVQRQPGANIIAGRRPRQGAPAAAAAPRCPRRSTSTILTDRTETVRASVEDVEFDAGAHHRRSSSWSSSSSCATSRATVIPSVAVPLSLVGTFGVMYLLGYSLNNLSLMALTISTGFVVDDAIVMIENIARYIEEGEAPLRGGAQGRRADRLHDRLADGVARSRCSSRCSSWAASSGGCSASSRSRSRRRSCVSALVSLTLTPMMCAQAAAPQAGPEQRPLLPARPSAPSSGSSRSTTGRCSWCCGTRRRRSSSRSRRSSLTVLLYVVVPKGFFPQQDTGLILGVSEAPQTCRSRRWPSGSRRSRDVDPAGPGRRERLVVHRRRRHQPDDQQRPHLRSPSSRSRSAGSSAGDDHPPPAARAREGRGHHALPAAGAGPARSTTASSRTQFQYTLEDADPRELARVGAAAGRRSCASAARAARRRERPAEPRACRRALVDRPRHRVAPRHHAAGDRRHALRRLRPAPGLDDLHAAEPVPRHPRGRSRSSSSDPTRSDAHLRALGDRRSGAAQRVRARRRRTTRRSRSTTRGSSRR